MCVLCVCNFFNVFQVHVISSVLFRVRVLFTRVQFSIIVEETCSSSNSKNIMQSTDGIMKPRPD